MASYDCKRKCGTSTHFLEITRPSDAVLSGFTVTGEGSGTYEAVVQYRIDHSQNKPGPDLLDTGIDIQRPLDCLVVISADGKTEVEITVNGTCP